eukprot:888162-Karenia_brevis.AAC.1
MAVTPLQPDCSEWLPAITGVPLHPDYVRCIGVGVMFVLEPELRSGIVREIVEKRKNCQSMCGIIVFLGMRWGINRRCWWEKRGKLGL